MPYPLPSLAREWGWAGISQDWLYRHAKTLPCTRRIGRKLLFDEGALTRWLAARSR